MPFQRTWLKQTGAGGHPRCRHSLPRPAFDKPFGGRNPASDFFPKRPIGPAQPGQLRGPEGGSEHATRGGMNFLFAQFLPQLGRICFAPRISPRDDFRKRFALLVQSH